MLREDSFAGEHLRATQSCRVCQTFHYCHADEDREIEIGDIDLISICLKIASNQRLPLSQDSFDIF
jgi:hypothetical protein